jgi:hypothetical protein
LKKSKSEEAKHLLSVADYLDRRGWFTLKQFQEERDGRVFKGALDLINSELTAGRRI